MRDHPVQLGPLPTTRWTLIGHASEGDPEALDELLHRYIPALRAHLTVDWRFAAEITEEFLQGFLAYKVLEKQLLDRADPARGKFRTFVLVSLDNYVRDCLRRQRSVEALPEVADSARTPERSFEAAWAIEVLHEALRRAREHCQNTAQEGSWRVLEARVIEPCLEGTPPEPYATLVERCGLDSPSEASNRLTNAKRILKRSILEVVAEYARDPDEIETELVQLRSALAGTSNRADPARNIVLP